MKYLLLFTMFFAGVITCSAQYPKVSVQDVMRLPADSITAGSLNSPLQGDTVVLRGVVTVPPVVKFPDSLQKILIAGNRNWAVFLRDEKSDATEFAGVTVICDTNNSDSRFNRLQIGQLVEITCRVANFPLTKLGTTQCELLAGSKVEFIDDGIAIPSPPQATIAEMVSGAVPGTPQLATGAKYAGMQVELRNVMVVSVVRNTGNGRTTVILQDDNGNQMYLRDQSNYFNTSQPINKFAPPPEGQRLSFVRGYITSNSVAGQTVPFMITPVFPGDVQIDASTTPPTIGQVRSARVNAFPSPTEAVPVMAVVRKGAADISSVKFYYTVNGGAKQAIDATKMNDTTYSASIPAQAANSLMRWKVEAIDANAVKVAAPPADTAYFFYRVLDRPATISDVREPLARNGNSVYQGYWVTLEGTVTASASDITRTGTLSQPRVYIQDGVEGFSALYLRSNSPNARIRAFGRGDKIRVKGVIVEDFNVTALDSIANADANLISTGNALPEPHQGVTADFARQTAGSQFAEMWESMVVELKNVVVTDTNADATGNFGEFNIVGEANFNNGNESQYKMRVETDEGNTSLATAPATGKRVLQRGAKITSIKGIMYFSFGNFKLIPRDDNDVLLDASGVENEVSELESFETYPNPLSVGAEIRMALSQPVFAVIMLIDNDGRVRENIGSGYFSAGNHMFSISANNLPAGTYTCLISTVSGVTARRVAVIH